jgi:hypothetical protein
MAKKPPRPSSVRTNYAGKTARKRPDPDLDPKPLGDDATYVAPAEEREEMEVSAPGRIDPTVVVHTMRELDLIREDLEASTGEFDLGPVIQQDASLQQVQPPMQAP